MSDPNELVDTIYENQNTIIERGISVPKTGPA
jgi:hypothetical protein